MQLIVRRNQDRGLLGGVSFTLDVRVALNEDEQALVKKYKVQKMTLLKKEGGLLGSLINEAVKEKSSVMGFFLERSQSMTIDTLQKGITTKAKDVSVLLEQEEMARDVCKNLKMLLNVMASFGGEEVIDIDALLLAEIAKDPQ